MFAFLLQTFRAFFFKVMHMRSCMSAIFVF